MNIATILLGLLTTWFIVSLCIVVHQGKRISKLQCDQNDISHELNRVEDTIGFKEKKDYSRFGLMYGDQRTRLNDLEEHLGIEWKDECITSERIPAGYTGRTKKT